MTSNISIGLKIGSTVTMVTNWKSKWLLMKIMNSEKFI
jgi:hypothetical protein